MYNGDMSDLKTNIRDGAYVALGAAALGVSQISKKTDEIKVHLNTFTSKLEPALKDVTPKIIEAKNAVSETVSPLTEKVGPVANNVVSQVKCYTQSALSSSKKIAEEAKKRVS